MTDRYAGYVVVMDVNMREDDAQATIAAIGQIKGVLTVEPVRGDGMEQIAQRRAASKIIGRIYDLCTDIMKGE